MDGTALADYLVYRPGAGGGRVRILREEGGFRVSGGLVELAEGVDAASAGRGGARGRLAERGVLGALRRAGARDGDEILLGDVRFTSSTIEDARVSPFGRIGVFGSLFNPPHLGHLLLCAEAAWQLGLERVILVPTGVPAHREAPPESPDVRPRLALAAASPDPVLTVSPRRGRPRRARRTWSTRCASCARRGLRRWCCCSAPTSSRRSTLVRARAAAGAGPHRGRAAGRARCAASMPPSVRMPQIGISSSLVRERVRRGQPIRHLVPEPVRALIESEGLYR